jgi:CRISPR-associated protein Cmr5
VTVRTKSQTMAHAAYSAVDQRLKPLLREDREKYTGFAREFPALVHACGLAQAVAFARAKKKHQLAYLGDLSAVLSAVGHGDGLDPLRLENATRELAVPGYIRLSGDALSAAEWLKRYAEAAGEE